MRRFAKFIAKTFFLYQNGNKDLRSEVTFSSKSKNICLTVAPLIQLRHVVPGFPCYRLSALQGGIVSTVQPDRATDVKLQRTV